MKDCNASPKSGVEWSLETPSTTRKQVQGPISSGDEKRIKAVFLDQGKRQARWSLNPP